MIIEAQIRRCAMVRRRRFSPEKTSHDMGPTLRRDFKDFKEPLPDASFVLIETTGARARAQEISSDLPAIDDLPEELSSEPPIEEPTEVGVLADKRPDTSEDLSESMQENALKALVLDPKIASWLRANDPKAYAQACAALGVEPTSSSLTCPHCGRSAVVDLQNHTEILLTECLEGRCTQGDR